MRSYWTCSKFADWLRGTAKPSSASSEGWYAWDKAAKAAHPFRFWLADTALDNLQTLIYYPTDRLHDVKYYINNRWVTRTHQLTAHPRDIKPGWWRDVGNRFLPCLFNELVEFVEVESAWNHIVWMDKADRVKYNPPWYATGWFRWRIWRCPQAGIDHYEWAASLRFNDEWCNPTDKHYGKPTPQAIAAQEILDLYHWWTEVRPNRPDAYDVSGWTELCESRRLTHEEDGIMFRDRSPAEKKQTKKALDLSHKIEAAYDKEDTAMMIRLIKIRDSLWT